jgi:hypothetical protein
LRRIRLLVVAALATASLGIAAPPASACQPDVPGGCCEDDAPNVLWRKLTGEDLYKCPW